ncbi:MAG: rhomboid family intramembrane serine protease [Porphyromonas somerae]|uniref:rhomboid family intramembrane serine protease n=2 Tax=Porphyromonas somerae TaxID=322095 RepID=UPI0026EC9876|nr:rhomboid family intramembrane serine protease [Porphyromonas somerae]MDD7557912.1 rhomboid family intramembrane serine protease [Porphyromonas somerae]MDY5816230.1 rhomboid family intramembrane serine protease [Porphyromonas somerae]
MMAGKTFTNRRFALLIPILLLYWVVISWGNGAISRLTLPSDGGTFLSQPWSLVTYGFVHTYWRHIVINVGMLLMLLLFSVGCGISNRTVLGLFLCGILSGGLLFLLIGDGVLVGASAGIAALVPLVLYKSVRQKRAWLLYAMLFVLIFDFATQRKLGQVTQGVHLMGYIVGILWVIFSERKKHLEETPSTEILVEKTRVSGYHSLTREEQEQLK